MNTCDCSRPTQNVLCDTCTNELARALHRVPGLLKELSTTAARLDAVKVGTSIESKTVSTTVPDPVNFSAITCADQLRRHVSYWVANDAEKIATAQWASQFKNGLDRLIAKAMTIIDREPERQHLGACPTEGCGEPMNPVKGEYEHHCNVCGETTVIAEHQGKKLGAAWSVTARPSQLVPVLKALGVRVSAQKVKDWVRSGKLEAAGESGGYPTYKVSDVYDVAMRMEARRRTTA